MKLPILHIARLFIPLAFVVTMAAGLVYGAVQQNFRMNANDPQIQIAEDIATQLSSGQPVNPNSLTASVDIAKSLSSYVLVYDDQGKAITASGRLDGQIPNLPAGVFDVAKKFGEDRLTWQPKPDVRSALVVVYYHNEQSSGYVAVGRSLREVEQRVFKLSLEVLAGWLAGIVGLIVLIVGGEIVVSRYSRE